MSQAVTVVGLASQKIVKIIPVPERFAEDLSLMNFLQGHGITIASSCDGMGTCKKCLVNHKLLSCQITLIDFLDVNPAAIVEIAYL